VCSLFVFDRNAIEMRKFGIDFHARPSKWRQITSVMGEGVFSIDCACMHMRYVHAYIGLIYKINTIFEDLLIKTQ